MSSTPLSSRPKAFVDSVHAFAHAMRATERSRLLASYDEYITKYVDTRPDPAEAGYNFTLRPSRPGITPEQTSEWRIVDRKLEAEQLACDESWTVTSVLMSLTDLLDSPFPYIRLLVKMYSDHWGLMRNDIKTLVDERNWLKLGVVLYADSQTLNRSSLKSYVTVEERRAIQYGINYLIEKYLMTTGPTLASVIVNKKTDEVDLDIAFENLWNRAIKRGASPRLDNFISIWKEEWAKSDVDILIEKYEKRVEAQRLHALLQ